MQITEDKVRITRDRLWVAQERQNKYLEQKHIPKTFEVGKKMM